MESQDTTPFSPEANQASSETERPLDTFSYDNDEEMILMQMAEDNDTPPTPGLKAAMEKSQYLNEVAEQQQSMPLFMERPKSSGIDVTAFCFTKPSGRNFSVKSSKPSAAKPPDREPVQGKQIPIEEPAKQKEPRSEEHSSDFSHVESQTWHSLHNDTRHRDTPRKCSPAAPQAQSVGGLDDQANPSGQGNSLSDGLDKAQAQDEAVGPMETTLRNGHDPESNHVELQNEYTQDTRYGGNTRMSISRTNTPMMTFISCAPSSHAPPKDRLRISKRRRTHSQKSTGCKSSAPCPVNIENLQLTEDDLFQILITRIRQREEDTVVAANLRKKLEATASQLAEENETLRAELEAYGAELQKKALESKTYRAQMNTWKTKLGKFKHVLNVLGADYQILRGESIHLRATRSALDKEGKELRSSIDDIRAQITKVTTSVGEKKSHFLESETIINTLRNDLKRSDEKARSIENQLHEERKRVMTLESYIQYHSLAQEKQLGLIRADHLGMNQKLDSAFEAMTKLWESSQTSIGSIMSPTMDKCLLAIKTLSEKESVDNVEIQKFADTINGFISRMDTVVPQLTKDFERNSEANDNIRTFFKEQLQNIENRFGADCDLYKNFSAMKEACGSLQEKLEIMGPDVWALNATILGFEEKESGLVRQIEEFERSLTEARDSAKQAPTFPENEGCSATVEITSQLEKVSEELRIAQDALQTKDMENQGVNHSLLKVTEALQEAETRAALYEAEVSSLQQQVQAVETRVREELSRASVIARDQNRAKFEQRLHGILKEKRAVEKDLESAKELLTTAQQLQLQNDALTEQHQEMQSLLLAKEQEFETLRTGSNENDSKYLAQDIELVRLRELESFYTDQQDLLRKNIDEANQKVTTLEAEIALNKVDQLALQELEKKFDELQSELSHKEEQRSSIQKELETVDAAKSALESGKEKAKGEIHALLLRVQDSERWMKTIKEKLEEFGVSTSTESFPEIWGKLETLLQSAITSGFPNPTSNVSSQQTSCTPAVASTPRKGGESPAEGFVQTTEVIYRTHNIPRSAYCSPAGRDSFQSGVGNGTIETVPDSQMSTNIVPFSNFQTRLSPVHCSPNQDDRDANDFASILEQISQREHLVKESNNLVNKARTEQSSGSTMEKDANSMSSWKRTDGSRTSNRKTSEVGTPVANPKFKNNAYDSQGINNIGDRQKAVTFEDQKIANTGSKRRTPESSHRGIPGGSTEGFERRPVRQNRRTYSRHRQTSPLREQAGQQEGMRADGELSYNENKRARVSTASHYPRSQMQAQDVPEPVERRLSPASLASGSSRQNTANQDPGNKRWAGRSQKRLGRKTRGERYGARFSGDGGAR